MLHRESLEESEEGDLWRLRGSVRIGIEIHRGHEELDGNIRHVGVVDELGREPALRQATGRSKRRLLAVQSVGNGSGTN